VRTLLLLGAGFALALASLLVLTRRVGVVQDVDRDARDGFNALLDTDREDLVLDILTRVVDPVPFAILLAGLAAYGLARASRARVVAFGVLVAGANLTTQILKSPWGDAGLSGTAGQDVELGSFPSGHATAAMSLGVGAVLLAPHGRRVAVAAAGGLFAVLQAIGLMAQDWHAPSETVGGHLVVGGWTCLVLAALLATRRLRARGGEPAADGASSLWRAAPALAALAVLVSGATVALAGPADALAYLVDHTTAVAAGLALAVGAVGLPLAVAAALPRPPRRVR
jgi:membrane-associated phospholipid phosphatase